MTILDANKGYLRAGFDDESGDLKLYDSSGNSLTGEGGLTITKTDPTTGQTVIIGPDSYPVLSTKIPGGETLATLGGSDFFTTTPSLSAANYTWETQVKSLVPFSGVRIGHENLHESADLTLSLSVAACPDASSDGSDLTFTPLPDLVIPPKTTAFSEFSVIDSVDRTDGGDGFLARVRVYSTQEIRSSNVTSASVVPAFNTASGREVAFKSYNGNRLNSGAITADTTRMIPSEVQILPKSGHPAVSVYIGGSSMQRGQGGTSGYYGSISRACDALQGTGLQVNVQNKAISGRTYQDSAAKILTDLARPDFKANIISISNHSSNSGWSVEAFAESAVLLEQIVKAALSRGIRVVIATQGPWPISGEQRARLLEHNASTVQKYSSVSGVVVYDSYSVMEDPSRPGLARVTDVVSARDAHYNDTGWDRDTPGHLRALQRIIYGI